MLAGSTASQLFIALCLGASLHAVGQHASLATLIVVLTLASIIGGAVPVPGGAGVIEVGLVGGLTAAGIPQSAAVAPALIERAVTAYLPLIWGGRRSCGCATASTSKGTLAAAPVIRRSLPSRTR